MKPPAITIFVPLATEETQEQSIICHYHAAQHLKVKLSSDHKMQDSVSYTCSCTSRYSQDLEEHNSQLQLSEVIPMLC